jgi:hypothetical protein
MLGLLLMNCVIWGICRYFFLANSGAELWRNQLALAQGLLLLDTPLVVWWYTDVTAQLARTSEAQRIRTQSSELVHNRPVVVGVLKDVYGVQNVGPGLAVAVWLVAEGSDGLFDRFLLGALGPSDFRPLPPRLREHLNHGRQAFALLSEGIWTRTAQWTLTVNGVGNRHHPGIFSRFVPIADVQGDRSVDEVIQSEGQSPRAALTSIEDFEPVTAVPNAGADGASSSQTFADHD